MFLSPEGRRAALYPVLDGKLDGRETGSSRWRCWPTAGQPETSGRRAPTALFGSHTIETVAKIPPRRRLLLLAVLVLVFATFYAYLDASGYCGDPGCPHFSQGHAPASAELPAAPLLVAAVAVAAPVLAGRVLGRPAIEEKPEEIYLSPDPDPPRV